MLLVLYLLLQLVHDVLLLHLQLVLQVHLLPVQLGLLNTQLLQLQAGGQADREESHYNVTRSHTYIVPHGA